jgi:hypothetical protein
MNEGVMVLISVLYRDTRTGFRYYAVRFFVVVKDGVDGWCLDRFFERSVKLSAYFSYIVYIGGLGVA